MTLDPLLGSTDYTRFVAKDQDWFLGAAGETIRGYCGWHIFPVVADTDVRVRIGAAGIVMLPTLNLVSVEAIRYGGTSLVTVDYETHDSGWIQLLGFNWRRLRNAYVTVDFTHGYEALPKAVAEVGFELAGRTIEKPTGVVKHMTRGPIDMDFNDFGAILSDDQKGRLAPYTVTRV